MAVTPEMLLTNAYNCLLQLYEFTKNEVAAGNASSQCEVSVKTTLMNMRILARYIAPRLNVHIAAQQSQGSQVAKSLPVAVSAATQT